MVLHSDRQRWEPFRYKSQDGYSVHWSQPLKRKDSQRVIEPKSFCLPDWDLPLGQTGSLCCLEMLSWRIIWTFYLQVRVSYVWSRCNTLTCYCDVLSWCNILTCYCDVAFASNLLEEEEEERQEEEKETHSGVRAISNAAIWNPRIACHFPWVSVTQI